MYHNSKVLLLNHISNLVSSCITDIILKKKLINIFGIYPQYSLDLAHHFHYFVFLGRTQNICQIHQDPLCVFTSNLVSISCFRLNFYEASCSIKVIAAHLLGVICVECLVSNNIIIKNMI